LDLRLKLVVVSYLRELKVIEGSWGCAAIILKPFDAVFTAIANSHEGMDERQTACCLWFCLLRSNLLSPTVPQLGRNDLFPTTIPKFPVTEGVRSA
jgi:hypothetical protein